LPLQRTIFAVAIVVAVGLSCCLSPAQGASCGTTDAKTGEPLRAVLTLDEKSTVTEAVFKRSTGHKTISLIFTVSGCELPRRDKRAAPPRTA
jgi:hypothetical protein